LHYGFVEVEVASLTLKNLPDDLLQALRKAADRDRRSLTQEIIHLLEVALRGGELMHPLISSRSHRAALDARRRG
jgi:plasmid stability protein